MIEKTLDRIKYGRKRNNMSQADLAELIGITAVMLCNIEKGKTRITLELFIKICKELNITPNELLGWDN